MQNCYCGSLLENIIYFISLKKNFLSYDEILIIATVTSKYSNQKKNITLKLKYKNDKNKYPRAITSLFKYTIYFFKY